MKQLYMRHKQTAHNFLWRNLQTLGKELYLLLVFFYSARMMSPRDFGLLNYLLAVAGLLVLFCDFGLSASASKYVAECKATNPERLRRVLSSVSVLILVIASLLSVAVVVVGTYMAWENLRYLMLLLPALFLMPLVGVLDGVYRGCEEFRRLSIINLIVLGLSLVPAFLLIGKYALPGAIISVNVLYLFLAIGMFLFRRETVFAVDRKTLADVVGYAVFIGLANLAYFLYTRVDMLILNQFDYVTEIGYYGIINAGFAVILVPLTILGQVIAPKTARRAVLGEYARIRSAFTRSLWPCMAVAVPLSLLLLIAIPFFLRLFLPQYCTDVFMRILVVLMILLPFKLWGVFTANGFITPGGFVRILTLFTFIGGVLNIVLDYVLIWRVGFIGVFWGTLVIHSLTIIAVNGVFYVRISRLAGAANPSPSAS